MRPAERAAGIGRDVQRPLATVGVGGLLSSVSDDRPITILAADTEERLRAAISGFRELAPKIPMLLVDAESL